MSYTNEETKIFAHNLYMLRKIRRLSQKELATIVGTSTYCIRKVESGVFPDNFSSSVIANIGRCFHLTPTTLFSPIHSIALLIKGEQDA